MHADHVRLRPVEERDLEMFVRHGSEPALAGGFSWYGYSGRGAVRDRFETDGYLGDHDGRLVVDTGDGNAAGFVSWHRVVHGPGDGSRCWNIGIFLLPEQRGRGVGAKAQRMFAEHLLATTPVARVEAETDVENVAEQRALEKAGFQREGILRRAQFRDGRWRDIVLFSRLRDEMSPT